MTTYSSKAAAKLGAKRLAKKDATFDLAAHDYQQNEEGRWIWVNTSKEVGEVEAPVSVPAEPAKPALTIVKRVEDAPTTAALPAIHARIKIEKNRETVENVVRRSTGTRSELVWALCDEMWKNGESITPKTLMAALAANGVDMFKNTAVHAMYRWKKFNKQ